MVPYKKCRKSIDRFLRTGRIGAIGHISCVDRRQRDSGSSEDNDLLNYLSAEGASQLTEICDLLGRAPAAVTAREAHDDSAASLQVFLRIDEQIGIHYTATFDNDPCGHELWIEGSNGSLRTDGNSVWWRKRGWPKFVPVRIGIFGVRSTASTQHALNDEMTQAIVDSASRRETVDMAQT